MSIFRRISFLGFALVSLVVLAACGDDGDDAFELPPPGEYSFEVTGTMEIEFLEPGVSAAPLALGEPETGEVSGGLTIQLGEDGSFTIKDKEGVNLVVGDLEGGPITFTQNEDNPSTGTIASDGTKVSVNVDATLDSGETATSETPIKLEGDGKLGVDSSVTLTTPDDALPPYYKVEYAEFTANFLFVLLELEEIDDDELEPFEPPPDLPTDMEEQQAEFTDPQGDAIDCTTGETVDDAAVDILSVSVRAADKGVVVEVGLGQSPLESAKDFSSAFLAQIGQEGRFQVAQDEVHDGELNSGRLDDAGNVIAGSEGDVTATDEKVTFTFPGTFLQPGDTVAAQSFHTKTASDMVNCDVTDAFPLDELVPCGGECTREQ